MPGESRGNRPTKSLRRDSRPCEIVNEKAPETRVSGAFAFWREIYSRKFVSGGSCRGPRILPVISVSAEDLIFILVRLASERDEDLVIAL